MYIIICLAAIFIGILTGGITSLIGASGVMVVVPILTILFHVNTHAAIGTSLFVDVIASIVVSFNYFKNGNVDIKSSIWIAVSSIAGAQLGTLFSSNINAGILSELFGVILVVSGIFMFIKSYKKTGGSNDIQKKTFRLKNKWLQILLSIIVGFVIGIISGLFGAGGGIMVLLALIFIMSYPLHKAIGTSTLIMTMTALSSTVGYAVRGNIDFRLGSMLAAGAVVGGMLGSRYANKVNEQTLQKVVSACFLFLGVAMTAIELVKLK